MKKHTHKKLEAIETNISSTTSRAEVIRSLRELDFADFSLLMFSMPNRSYPKISSRLPKMADVEVQKSWTGNSGDMLLTQTMDFVKTLVFGLAEISKQDLTNYTVLDFGCGYGRIARLMYYFLDESDFYGVDPWDRSIQICHDDGLTKNFYQSEYLPQELPVNDKKFDLIYAFSVFTHLSKMATLTCLKTLFRYLKKDGTIVITIRPVEYWQINSSYKDSAIDLMKKHEAEGFAFAPHNRDPVQGDVTYGDTSMNLEWILDEIPSIKIVKTDYSLSDRYQRYVFLKKD